MGIEIQIVVEIQRDIEIQIVEIQIVEIQIVVEIQIEIRIVIEIQIVIEIPCPSLQTRCLLLFVHYETLTQRSQ